MDTGSIIILAASVVLGGYMAFNVGANDVANSMGTSVGSRSLTIKQAIIAAGIANFLGAVLVGARVTGTISNGIASPEAFADKPPEMFMCGMLAALLAAGLWLQLATWRGWPVSTTHAIVGAVIGFAAVAVGLHSIHWTKVATIAAGWVACPFVSAALGYGVFALVRHFIIRSRDPIAATRRWVPWIVATVFVTLCMVIFYKGLKNLHLDFEFSQAIMISLLVGGMAGVFGWILIGRAQPPPEDHEVIQEHLEAHQAAQLSREVERALAALRSASALALEGAMQSELDMAAEAVESVASRANGITLEKPERAERSFRFVERVFSSLQVISACAVAFAHGGNDVANAVGPLSAISNTVFSGTVSATVGVPPWVLVWGGLCIAAGISILGYRVIRTIGERITHLTPTRGFAAEFATAFTVVTASRLGLPVSTTHTIVGAVLGVGLARGMASLDWKVLKGIFASWMVTIPAGAILAIVFYYILSAVIPHAGVA